MTRAFRGTTGVGWQDWHGENVTVADGEVTLTRAPPTYVEPTLVTDEVRVVDMALDPCDELYVLGVDAAGVSGVYVYDPERERLRRVLCLDAARGPDGREVAPGATTGADAEPAGDADETPDTGTTEDAEPDTTGDAEPDTTGDAEPDTTGDAEPGPTGDVDAAATADEAGESERWTPTALCVTDQHIAVGESRRAGDARNGRVRVFSRRLRQLRWVADRWEQPAETEPEHGDADGGQPADGDPNDGQPADGDSDAAPATEPVILHEPVALVADGERLFVLDRGEDGAGFLARIGRGGALAVVERGFEHPEDAAVDADSVRYVLDTRPDGSWIRTLDPAGGEEEAHADEGEGEVGDADEAGDDDDDRDWKVPETSESFRLASLAAVGDGTLVGGVDEATAGESTLYRWRRGDRRLERLASYRMAGGRLLAGVGPQGRVHGLYAVDGKAQLWFLRETARYARNEQSGTFEGSVVHGLDAGEDGTEWHRVRLDFELAGAGTQVRVACAATDDPFLDESVVDTAVKWQMLPPDPHDALLTDAVGRYLWVRVILVGSEDASPAVRSFRAYFPRDSYLRYLPSSYRDDPESAQFLERYLAVFESVYVDIESEIGAVTRFLDPDGVPGAYLTWLGDWLAVADDESWPDAARRELVAAAPDLYKRRGTRDGLRRVVELYLKHADLAPLEWTRSTATGRLADEDDASADADATEDDAPTDDDASADADATEDDASTDDDASDSPTGKEDASTEDDRLYLLEDADLDCIDTPESREAYRTLLSCPQCFAVLVGPGVDAGHIESIRRIVEEWSPAHTVGRTVALRPQIQLGGHSYLGVNSALTDRELVLSQSGLGGDSVLAEREAGAQLGVASRLGAEDGHRLS